MGRIIYIATNMEGDLKLVIRLISSAKKAAECNCLEAITI